MNEDGSGSKERISLMMAILIIGTAALVDGLQALLDLLVLGIGAIPILDLLDIVAGPALGLIASFLGLVADIGFVLWFKLLGVEYFGKNAGLKLATVATMTLITFIPEVDILPELTVGVATLVIQTRMEDALKNPKTARRLATAAKVVGTALPQARAAARVVELQAKRQAQAAEQQQQTKRAA